MGDLFGYAIELGLQEAKKDLDLPLRIKNLEYHSKVDKPKSCEEIEETLGEAINPIWDLIENEVVQLLRARGVAVRFDVVYGVYPIPEEIPNRQYLVGYLPITDENDVLGLATAEGVKMTLRPIPVNVKVPSVEFICFADLVGELQMSQTPLLINYQLSEFVKAIVKLQSLQRL